MDEALSNGSEMRRLVVVSLIAAGLFFLRLDCALLEPEEARYAEIPREMLSASEMIVPTLHNQPYLDKPPLLYWLVMGSYSLFGVHDWAARLVPGACGVLSVLLTYLWASRVFGSRIGFLSGLLLALTPRFVYLGRFVAMDAVLNICMVAALGSFHIATSGACRRLIWWGFAGCACGFGLLAKGPVVLILTAAPAISYFFLNRRAVRPGWREVTVFTLLMAIVAAPWYFVMLNEPGFASYFFWRQHVQRFVEPFDHPKPFWFYLPDLMAGTAPWCLLLFPMAARVYRFRQSLFQREGFPVLFPLLAAGWCLVFFSASGCKRVGYILPLFAPLAITLAWTIDGLLKAVDGRGVLWARALFFTSLCVVSVAGIVLAIFAYWSFIAAAVLGVILLGLGAMLMVRHRLSVRANFAATVAVCLVSSTLGVALALPMYNERFSLRRQVLTAQDQTSVDVPVVCHPRGWDSVNFYLSRSHVRTFSAAQRSEMKAYLNGLDEAVLFVRDGNNRDGYRLLDDLESTYAVEVLDRNGSHLALRISRSDRLALVSGAKSH